MNVPTTGSGPVISSNSQTLTTPPGADALIPAGALATAHAVGNPLAGNPVDGIGGSYVYSHNDLVTGGGGFPYALTFSRSYSSASYTADGGLGNGWSHNFTMAASRTSDPYVGLGDRTPIPAAPQRCRNFGRDQPRQRGGHIAGSATSPFRKIAFRLLLPQQKIFTLEVLS